MSPREAIAKALLAAQAQQMAALNQDRLEQQVSPMDRMLMQQRLRMPRLEEPLNLIPKPPEHWYQLPSGGTGYMT
jgi:hypothetical protein